MILGDESNSKLALVILGIANKIFVTGMFGPSTSITSFFIILIIINIIICIFIFAKAKKSSF